MDAMSKHTKAGAKTGPCFLCKREPALCDDPAEGRLATGARIDYRDTYANGPHAGEYKRIVFRGYLCDMHANSDDVLSIRYL